MIRVAIWCLIGLAVHLKYWQKPADPHDPLFWLDLIFWPMGLLYDWPNWMMHVSPELAKGFAFFLGMLFLFHIIDDRKRK